MPDPQSTKKAVVEAAVAHCAAAVTPGSDDIASYLAAHVADRTHREVVGPLLPASGASGVVMHQGQTLATWGDTTQPEMLFSATKTFVSLVAGVAFDDGLLDPDRRVVDDVPLTHLLTGPSVAITWEHLLQQTSGWSGTLWDKPAHVDAQSSEDGGHGTEPGRSWSYNDVRVNLLCLALTALFERPLDQVLRERVMQPVGTSNDWAWHGYRNSVIDHHGASMPVVVGGAHWGGGLFISAADLALVGNALLHRHTSPVSATWLTRSWTPCPANRSYGYLWWLNHEHKVFPDASTNGRCARGNLGRHLLWVDPAAALVVAAHWTEDIDLVLRHVTAAVS